MIDNIGGIREYPEISFIDDMTMEQLKNGMIKDFQEKYEEVTGKPLKLGKADPCRLILYACTLTIYQALQHIDRSGKQSFLKYAYGDFLENLGALKNVRRNQGTPAKATVKFTLSQKQRQTITIPEGTRITAGDQIYFYIDENIEIKAGETEVRTIATCTEIGEVGNGYEVASLNILVDPIPYIAAVENINTSSGGSDIEDDESLMERIYLAPSKYSVAGPRDAYVYWAKTFHPGIKDVKVESPYPTAVDIRFILENGELPTEALTEELKTFLSGDEIRPMTDLVFVAPPDIEEYDINLDYWVNESDRNIAVAIQEKVNIAIQNYIDWQESKIGRDINPSMLNKMIIEAGAKRTEIMTPVFKKIPSMSLGKLKTMEVRYGGTEDD